MSLINDALKKAQRLRGDKTAPDAVPLPGSGGRVATRKPAQSTNTIILLGSGALVLVVISVVVTVWLVNRPGPREVAAAKSAAAEPASSAIVAATPSIVPPALSPAPTPPASQSKAPTGTPEPASATAPVASASTSPATTSPVASSPPGLTVGSEPIESAAAKPAEPAFAPPASTPAPPAPAAPGKADERIGAFVDSIRVAGIRSSGSDSRVLMNDRVYRVNDIVERTLGVRLVKVAPESLTFSDANGVTYVKNF